MNPLIKSYLDQIDGELAALADNAGALTEKLADVEASRNELLKDFWGKEKEVAIQKEAARGFSELKERATALEEREQVLREHLSRVLAYTKALTEELRQ
ncbi:MAG: hypothetical protein HYV27_18390 [Candidatus Hydrogenedentes bacterium]|nr:hypothetical protein [Candidatus Hydrogenedentota bacterium]